MKVEFSAFPKAFSGNVAAFVAADKQLLATAQSINTDGTVARAIDASRFTGAKGESLTVLGRRQHRAPDAARRRQEPRARCPGRRGAGRHPRRRGQRGRPEGRHRRRRSGEGSRLTPAKIAARIALGAQLRNYRFDKYKTKDKSEQKNSLAEITVFSPAPPRRGAPTGSSSPRSTRCSSPATW